MIEDGRVRRLILMEGIGGWPVHVQISDKAAAAIEKALDRLQRRAAMSGDGDNGGVHQYPGRICSDCGRKFGRRMPEAATWSMGECHLCGRSGPVTQPRDFGNLKPGWEAAWTRDAPSRAKAGDAS